MMLHGTVKVWSHHVMAIVTRSYDTEKVIEGSGIDDIIQYDKSMLALCVITQKVWTDI